MTFDEDRACSNSIGAACQRSERPKLHAKFAPSAICLAWEHAYLNESAERLLVARERARSPHNIDPDIVDTKLMRWHTAGMRKQSTKVLFCSIIAMSIPVRPLSAQHAKPTIIGSTKKSSTSSLSSVPDGALDLSDLWPSRLQPAVETGTLALQPASSFTGGSGGASTPSFTGDPSFDGDSFEVNGQDDIVIPYFQMADQMRLDFEDGHQLQGPAEQPTQVAIKKLSKPKAMAKAADSARFHGTAYWNGGNSVFNANPFVLAGDPIPNPAYNSNNYGLTMGFGAVRAGSFEAEPARFHRSELRWPIVLHGRGQLWSGADGSSTSRKLFAIHGFGWNANSHLSSTELYAVSKQHDQHSAKSGGRCIAELSAAT
jgi:hypothetical protein